MVKCEKCFKILLVNIHSIYIKLSVRSPSGFTEIIEQHYLNCIKENPILISFKTKSVSDLIDWLIDWCLIPTLADLVLKLIEIGVSLFTVLFYTCLMECCGILHSYCYILWKMLDFFWHFGCLLLWTVFCVVKCASLHCASCMIVVKFFILNLFECY